MKGRIALQARLRASAALRGVRAHFGPFRRRRALWLGGAPATDADVRSWMDTLDMRELSQLEAVCAALSEAPGRTPLALEALLCRYIPGKPIDKNRALFEAERFYERARTVEADSAEVAQTYAQWAPPPPLPAVPLPPALVQRVSDAQRITWVLGAGISIGAGIPSYRGRGGVLNDAPLSKLMTLPAWLAHPDRVWAKINASRDFVRGRAPSPAHRAIVDICRGKQATVVTQNIDGLEARCGLPVIAMHGQLDGYRCQREEAYKDAPDPAWNDRSFPICPDCGTLLKPGVVFFFEGIDGDRFDRALDAIAQSDLVVEVGTSHRVKPVSSFWRYAVQKGAEVAIINPDTDATEGDVAFLLRGDCQQLLPALAAAVR